MQSIFLNEMRIWAMRFILESRNGNVGDSRCDKVTDSSESNVDVSL